MDIWKLLDRLLDNAGLLIFVLPWLGSLLRKLLPGSKRESTAKERPARTAKERKARAVAEARARREQTKITRAHFKALARKDSRLAQLLTESAVATPAPLEAADELVQAMREPEVVHIAPPPRVARRRVTPGLLRNAVLIEAALRPRR